MAKDPAVLWYWNDWNGGTVTFSRHLKGCYMDLLSAQFNQGPLSLDQIKIVLGTDQASWTVLSKKFKREVNGDGVEVFFNERMETEKKKRENFTARQAANGRRGVEARKQKIDPTLNPWVKPDRSNKENENEITGLGNGGPGEKPEGDEFLCFDAEQLLRSDQIRFEAICMSTGTAPDQGRAEIRPFHLHQVKRNYYPMSNAQAFAGFETWLLNAKKFNGGSQQTKTGISGKSNGAAALVSELKADLNFINRRDQDT